MTGNEVKPPGTLRLFLAGDVMLGRGIDQILPAPCDPRIHEHHVRSALGYVELAERRAGPIPRGVDPGYVWGPLPGDLDRRACDLRVVNLETAITRGGTPAPKGINYRVSPQNAVALCAAGIDACGLANNHVLDWGTAGLVDTLDTLDRLGVGRAGAGRTAQEAARPLSLGARGGGRVLLAARGMESSGVPPGWQAGAGLPGIAMLPPLPADGAGMLAAALAPHRARGDVTVLSVHWGANWGFDVPRAQRRLGHALIDVAGVDVVFGHSAHHPMGIELYRGKLILHGCGDLVNDYEGIGGQEDFMPRLAVAFILDIDQQTGRAAGLEMLPYRRRAFALERARAGVVDWLHAMLARESLLADAALERSGPGAIRLVMAAG